jgi:NitT/TauT family transport system substrate-binding protein
MLLLWSRTNGQVKAVSAAAAVPLILVTRNPKVKTIADFTDSDKIAVPTVKVSMQSTILGIAARQMFGEAARGKFDPLTVTMAHPDATAFLLSGSGEVNSHFSAPPYQYQAMKSPAVHMVLNSTEVMGGPATITVIFGTAKFYDANPKTIAAIRAALDDAMAIIAKDRKAAADMYLEVTKEKMAAGELAEMAGLPGFEFTTTPHGTMKYAEQMHATGIIKTKPAQWSEVFFPSAHGLAGD